jgi:RHS repeat-associated protein
LWLAGICIVQAQQPLDTLKFPAAVKITRDGREPVAHASPVFAFEDLSEGTEHAVFPGPPCLEGSYYVGFQLYYDLLGHRNTTIPWSDYLEVSLLHGEDTLWRQPLRLDMQSQTFLATIFHDKPITCDGDYRFFINRHDSTGVAPVDYIDLRVLLYKQDQDVFSPALAIDLDYCTSPSTDHVTVAWSYAGAAWLEYDLEWVFIEEHESTNTMTPQQAFRFKRPARITTAASHWDHLAYYPKGRIWYRVRAVGYDPRYPGHRIPGAWSYSACGARAVENHEPGKTWQKQVVFAEEGKSKTIMQYFDGTLRQRQSLTNLNQEKVTVVAESLYDFEGRQSSDIMAVPTVDASLKYHETFNTFQIQDPVVDANTGPGRSKFHYDNYRLTNSILSNASGAANYYSPQSHDSTIHQAFIPDAEGYVYSQAEYLRDGTGRISRQSGVGKEFRMDGQHITRYYYAEPNREELIRLFGTNVGDVSHYKKNLVVDPNGQVSVSYQDQEDRVIATALAGDAPLNVEHLPSYDSLSTDSITVSILDRNTFQGTISETITKVTNVSPSRYTFRYNLSALGATVEGLGCQTCKYDLDLVLTDPEGMKVNLSAFSGNQTPTAKRDGTYRRIGITAASCNDSTEAGEVVLSIWMSEIGSYTLTKTLKAHELTYNEMATQVRQDATFQQQVAALQQHFGVDTANCEICTSACPGTDSLVNQAIEDVSRLDCDNILQQILSDIRTAHAGEEQIYTPKQSDLDMHPLYCKYLRCNQNVDSDIFDRRLARHVSWEDAYAEYPMALDSDPFFNDPALSGMGSKTTMVNSLADVNIGTIPYDVNGDGAQDGSKTYRGSIEDVVRPDNKAFWVDINGVPDDVNGRHILYLDLMSRRGQLGEAAYEQQLSQQRWTMYRSFYMEAKRKIKLTLYQGCSSAMEELQASDELLALDTRQEAVTWAEQNGAIGYTPVSNSEIETAINSIRNACGVEIDSLDRVAITGYLRTYFNSNAKNYLRLIFQQDIGINPSLVSIQNVLNHYSCSLNSVGRKDPMTCESDTLIYYHYLNQPTSLSIASAAAIQLNPLSRESREAERKERMRARTEKLRVELVKEQTDALARASKNNASLRAGATATISSISQQEYDALMAIYAATGGGTWTNNAGWEDADPNVVQDVTGWYGVLTNAQGHVYGLNLNGNGLTGYIPGAIGQLTELTGLNLSDNDQLTGSIPIEIGNLTKLTYLDMSNNSGLTGSIPSEIGNLIKLTQLILNNLENVGGVLPTTMGNMEKLQAVQIQGTGISGPIPATLGNLHNLEMLYLTFSKFDGSIPPELALIGGNLEELSLDGNKLSGSLPKELSALSGLKYFSASYNETLTGIIPPEYGQLSSLRTLVLSSCNLIGSIPAELGQLDELIALDLEENQLSGPVPPQLGNLTLLRSLNLYNNKLTGTIPSELGNLINIKKHPTEIGDGWLTLSGNKLEGTVPASLGNLVNASLIDLAGNMLSGNIPESLINLKNVRTVTIDRNRFTFTDFLKIKQGFNGTGTLNYSPQDSVDVNKITWVSLGGTIVLSAQVDRNTNPLSKYQWYRGNTPLISPATESGHTVTIANAQESDLNKKYYYKISNPSAPGLVLISRKQSVRKFNGEIINFCLSFDTTNTILGKFNFFIDWNQRFQDCIKNAHVEDSLLFVSATNKILETYVGRFDRAYTTTCFDNTLEDLNYTYTPREYHYTLYYYDQAANLVQTVPPAGVHPLDHDQVLQFSNQSANPPHTLLTRYRYNSLNQLIWQSTPDAGESNFWYNDQGQLRLSQNAQQHKDTVYSYSRYDEQGRIVEVGEMATVVPSDTLALRMDSLLFPQAASYTLTDITRTHYDFLRPGLPNDFEQQHLRTRVSWVEVLEKYHTDTISTTYSYDVHGNVKSLLQDIPGLSPKRTDYVYDLVSGKVNYVLYQFAQSDQFIHRYGYDDDNRITDVHTSSDGFIWDHDARYYYYKHGPLARTELGEYRVQGLDYYYTLQGWVKGVNMPYQDNAAVGNLLDEGVGKDVFSYALGYYQGDYKPVAPGLVPPETRDKLWTRQQEMHGHTGLYNGNISWMITDLAKLGEVAGNRAKGMQAMLYKYDQLHRLVKSRGLTQYGLIDGFAYREQSPGAYDENYTYDPNGNIQTLLRHNETGGVMDNFNYEYYGNSNKLREVKPVTKTKEYTSGPIRTDNIVYRNVKIHGTAHVPVGSTVEVKALDDIFMDPDFQAHEESDFWAHIVDDEGTYQYDAVGNLILDQDAGVQIRWTPYGKVRDVHLRGDSVIISFRYDATGNRSEKKVITRDTVENVNIIRYVRDVDGEVLGVYTNSAISERPIYGQSRIGQCIYSDGEGYRRLGKRRYELTNQLGNVVSVIADSIEMSRDNVWATVLGAGDFYSFGLEMVGRTFLGASEYRYGFNGKEKDNKIEWGNTTYDYGFRIYNPSLGKFLSVDPLTKSYPMLTPYQFASNRPIDGVDLDGLEYSPVNQTNAKDYGEFNIWLGKQIKEYFSGPSWSKQPVDPNYAAALENANGWPEGSIKTNGDAVLANISMLGQRGAGGHPYRSGGPLPTGKSPRLRIARAPVIVEEHPYGPQRNSALYKKYQADLALEAKASPFHKDGTLKPQVLTNSEIIIKGTDIKNINLVQILTLDGSSMNDWNKVSYSVRSGEQHYQIHYYLNSKTGAVYYDLDYKVKLNSEYSKTSSDPNETGNSTYDK